MPKITSGAPPLAGLIRSATTTPFTKTESAAQPAPTSAGWLKTPSSSAERRQAASLTSLRSLAKNPNANGAVFSNWFNSSFGSNPSPAQAKQAVAELKTMLSEGTPANPAFALTAKVTLDLIDGALKADAAAAAPKPAPGSLMAKMDALIESDPSMAKPTDRDIRSAQEWENKPNVALSKKFADAGLDTLSPEDLRHLPEPTE
jgi:hypothetical protein